MPESLLVGGMTEELFGYVGRVTVLTSLVEARVDGMASSWSAGNSPIGAQIKALRRVASHLQDSQGKTRCVRFFDDVARLRDYRHKVVHSVWPREWFGWRPAQPGVAAGAPARTFNTTRDELRAHVVLAASLIEDVNTVAALLEATRSSP